MIKKIKNKRLEKKNLLQVFIRPLRSHETNFKIILKLKKRFSKLLNKLNHFSNSFPKSFS